MTRIRDTFEDLDSEQPDLDADDQDNLDEGDDIFTDTNSLAQEMTEDDILELQAKHKLEMDALLIRKGMGDCIKDDKTSSGGKGEKGDKEFQWRPANTLDAPPPRPGMAQRWVRFMLGEKDDPKNWSRAKREGWTPRDVATVPEGYNAPTFKHGHLGTVIQVGDLILCEMDERLYASRKKYFAIKAKRQRDAMERRPLAGTPIRVEERKASVTWGRRKAQATDD